MKKRDLADKGDKNLHPTIFHHTETLDKDEVFGILVKSDIYRPSQPEIDEHIAKSQFCTVLEYSRKGNPLTETQFDKILDSDHVYDHEIITSQLGGKYVPTLNQVQRFSPELRREFAGILNAKGIDITAHVLQAQSTLESSSGSPLIRD